ncbi:MAG TPA: 50S ribosomal protein L15 [bacterium]
MSESTKTPAGPAGELAAHRLAPAPGAKKRCKRVGRGVGSGHGKTSCRGGKGQTARSGGSIRPGFEGGQMPLQRRLPKRGFHNPFRTAYEVVNIGQLAGFEGGAEVDPAALRAKRLVRRGDAPVKVLADGELSAALKVRAHAVSAAARKKIEAAGGSVELIA